MDITSQEGLKKTVMTGMEDASEVGRDQKPKGGCRAAEIIRNIPRLQMWWAERSHVFSSEVSTQVTERNKGTMHTQDTNYSQMHRHMPQGTES